MEVTENILSNPNSFVDDGPRWKIQLMKKAKTSADTDILSQKKRQKLKALGTSMILRSHKKVGSTIISSSDIL